MKINEVAIREAEPNYEVDPAEARIAAIATKLMDKSKITADERLSIALSKVAYHLSDYGTPFGPKNMQQLLDMVNGEGKYAPDADMPMDNKNPIKHELIPATNCAGTISTVGNFLTIIINIANVIGIVNAAKLPDNSPGDSELPTIKKTPESAKIIEVKIISLIFSFKKK